MNGLLGLFPFRLSRVHRALEGPRNEPRNSQLESQNDLQNSRSRGNTAGTRVSFGFAFVEMGWMSVFV